MEGEHNSITILSLSEELLIHVFCFLDAKTLCKTAFVSRGWYHCATDGQLWKHLLGKPQNLLCPYTHQLSMKENLGWKRLYFELEIFWRNEFKNNSVNALKQSSSLVNELSGIEASTTDHKNQDISKTLDLNDDTFWSSTGSSDVTSGEYLIYKLIQPVCIVSCVAIAPYQASFQMGQPIYAPQSIQVSVGFSAHMMHWKSTVQPVLNKTALAWVYILPEVVVGGYVRLDLMGRYQTQPQDDLYYTVLQEVRIKGSPVGALKKYPYVARGMLRFALSQDVFFSSFEFAKSQSPLENIIKKHRTLASSSVVSDLDEFDTINKKNIALVQSLCNNEEFCTEMIEAFTTQSLPTLLKDKLQREMEGVFFDLTKTPDFQKAVAFVTSEPGSILRTDPQVISILSIGGPVILKQYFSALLRQEGALNKMESLELSKLLLGEQPNINIHFISLWIQQEKLTPSQELADLVRKYDINLAIRLYIECMIPDKVLECFKQIKQWGRLIAYANAYRYKLDYSRTLKEVYSTDPLNGLKLACAIADTRNEPPLPLEEVCSILEIDPKDEWDLRKLIKQKLADYEQQNQTSSATLSPAPSSTVQNIIGQYIQEGELDFDINEDSDEESDQE